ncbi:hypothetical protein LTR66_008234 [Elasticomyces elasticus]|nr:hypothetical protein LTR66_008234 [Elasticomyces elasticus]
MGEQSAAELSAISKTELERDGSSSSIVSTPEHETEIAQDQAQPQKRKGGRKPIYATSEERKQRNRQAQAAFRERRTEYIKQLEATIKAHEDNLQSLQQSHRNAADECLMLRYKNSLLERILLEKGIDIQAELHAKGGSPASRPTVLPPPASGSLTQPPMQRTVVSRQHQARRSGQGFGPKLAAGPIVTQGHADVSHATLSPQGQPTPSSHASSPASFHRRSPTSVPQDGMTPPASAILAQHQQQYHRSQQQPPRAHFVPHSTVPQQRPPPTSYPSSSEHEYDSEATMLDERSTSDQSMCTANLPTYRQEFAPPPRPPQQQQMIPQGISSHMQQSAPYQGSPRPPPTQSQHPAGGDPFPGYPYDTMLDADPFGLSASMHYPTSYSFDQHPHTR